MNITFTKENLSVLSVEIDADKNGSGSIFLSIPTGEIEIEVEHYMGVTELSSHSHLSTEDGETYTYFYLDDYSIETVNNYLKDSGTIDKFIEEANEAASQSM